MLQEAGAQPLHTYIDWRQVEVPKLTALLPIFEVCMKKTGYKGGGRHRKLWSRQVEANKQLRTTLEEILEAMRDR